MSTPEIAEDMAQLLAQYSQQPVGLCAIVCSALWQQWYLNTGQRLCLCIAFHENVAHHVFLRWGSFTIDPTGHQFDTHRAYVLDTSLYPRPLHQQCTVETHCLDHFLDLLKEVGWPYQQWPTRERVRPIQLLLERYWPNVGERVSN